MRNKWSYDNSPTGDPLVTISLDGKVTTPKKADEFTAAEKDRLRNYGVEVDYVIPAPSSYVARTYQRQTLPAPKIQRDLGTRGY